MPITWKLGTELIPSARAHALRAFVHRMTAEARAQFPEFRDYMLANGYRMPERTDAEWLARTRFAVRRDGQLDSRVRHCQTSY